MQVVLLLHFDAILTTQSDILLRRQMQIWLKSLENKSHLAFYEGNNDTITSMRPISLSGSILMQQLMSQSSSNSTPV